MDERRIDGFFYGLFMDVAVLKSSGVEPINVRQAFVDDFALRIGRRATLTPSKGARAYGMLIALTHAELERLYGGAGGVVPALCYNLVIEPTADERNPDYARRLQQTLRALNFPSACVDSLTEAVSGTF